MGLEALVPTGREAKRDARCKAGVFVCAFLAAALTGCSSLVPQANALSEAQPADLGLAEKVELVYVPFFPQVEYQCGPAALAMVLAGYGAKVTPDDLVAQVYLPERKGSLQIEMLAAARRHGMVSYMLAPRFEHLLREVSAGNPVIVLWDQSPLGTWHYAVAVGYDYEKGKLILRSGETEREQVPFAIHEMLWLRSAYWAMVALPPDRIPATADETRWLGAISALESAGGVSEARTAYSTFLKRWPENTGAAIGLANTHHALGELAQAESVLREAAQRAPDSVIVLNNLAQTLSDQKRDAEALPLIERAAALGGPYAAAVQETRQGILTRLGRKN